MSCARSDVLLLSTRTTACPLPCLRPVWHPPHAQQHHSTTPASTCLFSRPASFRVLLSLKVHLLNLAYDLLPADFVTVVVTEMGAVPATSVAVILREAQRDSALL